jgi:hypothetical protein
LIEKNYWRILWEKTYFYVSISRGFGPMLECQGETKELYRSNRVNSFEALWMPFIHGNNTLVMEGEECSSAELCKTGCITHSWQPSLRLFIWVRGHESVVEFALLFTRHFAIEDSKNLGFLLKLTLLMAAEHRSHFVIIKKISIKTRNEKIMMNIRRRNNLIQLVTKTCFT